MKQTTMKITKKELRKYIAAQKALNQSVAAQESAEVMSVLESHPAFKNASTLLLYHSLPDEVDTHDFIRKWAEEKTILLPVVVGEELELRLYTGPDSMRIGAYHIEEPTGEVFTDYSSIDLAIVPGVAFDNQGNRLGRGKGYYDRLLPHLTHTYKIGICFSFQQIEEVPSEAFDIRMDEVISATAK